MSSELINADEVLIYRDAGLWVVEDILCHLLVRKSGSHLERWDTEVYVDREKNTKPRA